MTLRYSKDAATNDAIKFFLGRLAVYPRARQLLLVVFGIFLAAVLIVFAFFLTQFYYVEGSKERCYGPPSLTCRLTRVGLVLDEGQPAATIEVSSPKFRGAQNFTLDSATFHFCYWPRHQNQDAWVFQRCMNTDDCVLHRRDVFLHCAVGQKCTLASSSTHRMIWKLLYILNGAISLIVGCVAAVLFFALLHVYCIVMERRRIKSNVYSAD